MDPSPAWRQFELFNPSAPLSTFSLPPPHQILASTVNSSHSILYLSLSDATIRAYDAHGERKSLALEGPCSLLAISSDRYLYCILEGSPSVLKIYDLSRSTPPLLNTIKLRPSPATALAISPSSPSSSTVHVATGHTDGAVLVLRNMHSHLSSNSNPRVRQVHSDSSPITGLAFSLSSHPLAQQTNGKAAATGDGVPHLYISTPTHTHSLPVSSKGTLPPSTLADPQGSNVGCLVSSLSSSPIPSSSSSEQSPDATTTNTVEWKTILARPEAVYVYGSEGREGCYALEGDKTMVVPFSNYVVLVSPPVLPTASDISRTIRGAERGKEVGKLTIVDLGNRFVGYNTTFESGVREVWSLFGAVYVYTNAGECVKLEERKVEEVLEAFCERNLYTLALGYVDSRGLGGAGLGEWRVEICRRYADHLYTKGDWEGSMGWYIKTVGGLQPSYVIRKFLDGQRIKLLISYLQVLHSRGLATSDHTTLLLNCYTKSKDLSSLDSFLSSTLPSSSSTTSKDKEDLPFDLHTAIRVCRQAGLSDHALLLASRWGEKEDRMSILVEDRTDWEEAIKFLRELVGDEETERDEVEGFLLRYGRKLLKERERAFTGLVRDFCLGLAPADEEEEEDGEEKEDKSVVEKKGYFSYFATIASSGHTRSHKEKEKEKENGTDAPSLPSPPRKRTMKEEEALPDVRIFFSLYIDHPLSLISLLESVLSHLSTTTIDLTAAQTQTVWNTLLELYVRMGGEWGSKALELLKDERAGYEPNQALLVCTMCGYEEGLVVLYEKMAMFVEVLRLHIALGGEEGERLVVSTLRRYLREKGMRKEDLVECMRVGLRWLTEEEGRLSRQRDQVLEFLQVVEERKLLKPIEVLECVQGNVSVGVVRGFLKGWLEEERKETESDRGLISSYRSETAKKEEEIAALKNPTQPSIFQVTRCSACGGTLEPPIVHYMCKHSYHDRCIPVSSPACPACSRRHDMIREIKNNNMALADQHGLFEEEVKEAAEEGEGWNVVVERFGKGLFLGNLGGEIAA
ncbi:hypothetical protein BT69DRAFT_1269971 [Atractiella rhizophila]|nr:hypothetical protein BT69DRAFT_1269971 [Atractiella rhizophila]